MRPATKRGRRLRDAADLLRRARCPSSACRTRIGWMCSIPCAGRHRGPAGVHALQPARCDLQPDGTPFDDRQLVFFSSPNKGLAYTLDAFGALHRAMPDLRLIVGKSRLQGGCARVARGRAVPGPAAAAGDARPCAPLAVRLPAKLPDTRDLWLGICRVTLRSARRCSRTISALRLKSSVIRGRCCRCRQPTAATKPWSGRLRRGGESCPRDWPRNGIV